MALYPYSDPDLPKYVNYGSLGMLIGHEMGHAFSLKVMTLCFVFSIIIKFLPRKKLPLETRQ